MKRSKDSRVPMDFLKTIVSNGGGGGGGGYTHCFNEGEENVQLSLGLSLNGRFGVERRRVAANDYHDNDNNNKLIRASSVADVSRFPAAMEDPTALTVYPPLTRMCSLPIETEEAWKKRQELQAFYRSEAKRKRVEKLKNGKVVKGLSTEENCEAKRRIVMKGNELWQSSLLPPLPGRPSLFPSQVSVGSPASGGSSGVSDLESQPFSGRTKDADLKSTASQNPVSHKISSSSPYRSNSVVSNRSDETLKMMFVDMPSVSTKGDGVNGKKIEGFLYKYKKGEQVRIVCVCHGDFLTPAEFVKHGGGGDVEHPLRHIVVNPPSP